MSSSRKRYVFDTNVIVSALLFEDSLPGRAFYEALDHGEILISDDVVGELHEVLNREKFDSYLRREEREAFLDSLIRETTLVEISRRIIACRDPKDDKFLELEVNGSASYIITGDSDLLVLNPFEGIPILTPSQFLN